MKIGDYETTRLLGKGGMSEVYEAENVRLGSRHAVKVFAYQGGDAEVRERFEIEGKLLAKLNHPRVVGVSDLGTLADGRPYFVMDLVLDESGAVKSLADVGDGGADEETIGRWYDDIRDALNYIHGKGVVHRDLKLQNVLVGPDGHAVLTDFGISRVFSPDENGQTVVEAVNTLVHSQDGRKPLMGSLGYMAPELEMGVAASPQSDWYALGVLTFKLLTGIWCDARTDVRAMLETYDPAWTRILPKLLHSNPFARECLSYREEKLADQERLAYEAEERWLKEKSRGHLARHLARYVTGAVVVLGIAVFILARELKLAREELGEKTRQQLTNEGGLGFDTLFRIPAEARASETLDDEGNVLMPSRSDFEAARIDVLVLTYDSFAALHAGTITPERLLHQLEQYAAGLEEDSEDSPFDSLPVGEMEYTQMGDNEPARILLQGAVERLKEMIEE